MNLDEFIASVREDVDSFEEMWKAKHVLYPEAYPLEIDESNDGIWWEQFMAYCEMNGR